MVGRETRFEDCCEITSVRNGISTEGEIIRFKENEMIVAAIHRSAKVTLHWDDRVNLYVGSLGGVEFQSSGPKSTTVRTHR